MSLVAIVNLAERLLNQTPEQDQQTPSSTKQGKGVVGSITRPLNGDQFTPSALTGPPTAQEAGLFNVNPSVLFSAAADLLLAQIAAQGAAQTETPSFLQKPTSSAVPQALPTPPSASANPAPSTVPSAAPPPQTVAQTSNTRTEALNTGAPAAIQSATSTEEVQITAGIPETASITAQPNAQSQLQALNNALNALGLGRADIAVVDRIATLIKDFNPVVYTSLVYQLEALANTHAPKASTPPSALSSSLPEARSQNSIQIQSLVIRFTSANETIQTASPQNGNTTVQFSGFKLQIEGVSLTFTNGSGQAIQVEAPQTANHNDSPSGPVNTKARAASA